MRIETREQRLTRLTFLRQRIDAEIRELAGQVPLMKRSRSNRPPCGTESGYQRHRYYGEDRCDACKAAHRLHNRARYAAQAAGLATAKSRRLQEASRSRTTRTTS